MTATLNIRDMLEQLLAEAPESAANFRQAADTVRRLLERHCRFLADSHDLFSQPPVSGIGMPLAFLEDGEIEGTQGAVHDLLGQARALAFVHWLLLGLEPNEGLIRQAATKGHHDASVRAP